MSTSNDKKEPKASRQAIRDQCLKKLENMERRLDALAKKLESDSK